MNNKDLKTCTKCRSEQPLDNFYKRGDGAKQKLRSWCVDCTTKYVYSKNPPKTNIKRASRRKNRLLPLNLRLRCDPKRAALESHLRRYYDITLAQYLEMVDAQKGVCAICAKAPEGRLHVDHNHKTGKVRALLCNNCNWALGLFKDNAETILAAAAYIEKWKA